MKRRKRLLPALFVIAAAGCAGPEAGSEVWVLGSIMILIGLAVAVALVFSLND